MVEDPKSLRLRMFLAHGFMIGFIILIMFPFLMVLSISFREGNFSTGALLPENPTFEHWSLAFGIPSEPSDGTIVEPPFPVMLWLWNSIKVALIASMGILTPSGRWYRGWRWIPIPRLFSPIFLPSPSIFGR